MNRARSRSKTKDKKYQPNRGRHRAHKENRLDFQASYSGTFLYVCVGSGMDALSLVSMNDVVEPVPRTVTAPPAPIKTACWSKFS